MIRTNQALSEKGMIEFYVLSQMDISSEVLGLLVESNKAQIVKQNKPNLYYIIILFLGNLYNGYVNLLPPFPACMSNLLIKISKTSNTTWHHFF